MKLIKELIQEGKRLNLGPHASQVYAGKGYDAKQGFITGGGLYSNNWSREDIALAVGEIQKSQEFKNVEKRMKFNSTSVELKNGTLSFKSPQPNERGAGEKTGTEIKVYLGGQIRSQTKTQYKARSITRIKSPKPKMVAGDPVASAVKAYKGALQAVAERYDRIAAKKSKTNESLNESTFSDDSVDMTPNFINYLKKNGITYKELGGHGLVTFTASRDKLEKMIDDQWGDDADDYKNEIKD